MLLLSLGAGFVIVPAPKKKEKTMQIDKTSKIVTKYDKRIINRYDRELTEPPLKCAKCGSLKDCDCVWGRK